MQVLKKMNVLILLSFLLLISVVKSEDVKNQTECKDFYKDMNNEPINVTQYCNKRSCIIKCCGDGEILNPWVICETAKNFNRFYSRVNYSKVLIHSWEGSAPKISNKKLAKDLVFIQNEIFSIPECSVRPSIDKKYILEDGTIKLKDSFTKTWIDIPRSDYCADFMIYGNRKQWLLFVFKEVVPKKLEIDSFKSKFLPIGLLTSCFFFLLVLAVYCLLRQLRNIGGMIFMGYVWSLFVTYLLRAILDLIAESITFKTCKIFSPIVYYAILSSFSWVTIMSFDVWCIFRGTRKSCELNRRGEVVKFLWYCLYGWGAPLGLTTVAVFLDNKNLSIMKPPFASCLADRDPMYYYMLLPIAVVFSVNILLFLMTARNIWLVKRALHNNRDSRRSKKEESRFVMCIRLAVLMGLGWGLELLPETKSQWMYILINSYNVFMGPVIFILFVFKKSILIMLCKRFGINNDFVQNLQSQPSRSGTASSSKMLVSKHSRSQTGESTC